MTKGALSARERGLAVFAVLAILIAGALIFWNVKKDQGHETAVKVPIFGKARKQQNAETPSSGASDRMSTR